MKRVIMATIGLLPLAGCMTVAPPAKTGDTAQSFLYEFDVHEVELERFAGDGGAIAPLRDGLLVATSAGRLATVRVGEVPRYLTGRVPMNLPALESHEIAGNPKFKMKTFRVNDVLLRERNADQWDLFVSHLYFTGDCFLMRVSLTTLFAESTGRFDISPSWRTIYDTTPCLAPGFDAYRSGGSLLTDGPDHLLLTVGDFNRFRSGEPQNLDVSLGKIMRIAIATGEAEIFSLGHRNPQGLARDRDGKLWATEHGPWGADELNLIERGNDYGWPYASDGRAGGRTPLPLRDHPHTPPAFAWVPGIGSGSVVVNDGQALPLWRDDLLIASLRGRSLFRVRHEEQRVRYVEAIWLGHRIRDLAMLPNGRLVLLSGSRLVFLNVKRAHRVAAAATRLGPALAAG